jgi:adenosylcobinamide-GDP ribazoletransferase
VSPLRLLLGTLTVLPVRAPATVDRRTAGRAMALSPLAGLVLAVLVGVPLQAVQDWLPGSPLLLATLAVGTLALLTRGLHLDGLADTADGLGSGRDADRALAVMRRGDVGPFGVAAVVLVLLVQVAALAQCLAVGVGPAALGVALVVSRGSLALLCTPAFPAARAEGLGRAVAGSVSVPWAAAGMALTALLVAGVVAGSAALGPSDEDRLLRMLVVSALGLLPGLVLARRAVARLGGVTGDVYGAAVEVICASVLVAVALAAG